MRSTFGTAWQRWLWNGTKLTEVEFELLQRLVDSLPLELRAIVEAQFDAYNLVQREVDGRALNFYRKKNGRPNNMDGLPLLKMDSDEAVLVRLTADIDGDDKPLHATLTAVSGRVFCMALSRRPPANGKVTVVNTKPSWRSNFSSQKNDPGSDMRF